MVIDLFVAKNGTDTGTGTKDRPFAALEQARAAVRELKSKAPLPGPVNIVLRSGAYDVPDPFVLHAEDSGTAECPVTYMAYPGEKATISGGRRITGWQPGEGDLWKAELTEVKAGKWYFRQLFVNGTRRVRARLPEAGQFYLAAGSYSEYGSEFRNKTSFRFKPGDIKKWHTFTDAEVVFIHRFDISRMNIVDIDEKECLVDFPTEALWNYQTDRRYWVENLREGLTGPGTWFLDRHEGVLYYWPMPDENMAEAVAIAPAMEFLVRLEGDPAAGKFVEYVNFRGLTFCHNDWTMPKTGFPSFQAAYEIPGAIYAEGGRHCRIEHNEITQSGTYGVQFARACRNNVIAYNHIHDMGAGGIKIGEGVHRSDAMDETCENAVCDNTIHDGGKVHLGAVGVWIGLAHHNRVAHNEIYDLFYTGISVGWEWSFIPTRAHDNIIEYNHLHDLLKHVLSDGGGIYSLGYQPGTIIRNNLIHGVYTHEAGCGRGIYLDEGSLGIMVENNVIHHVRSAGIRMQIGSIGNIIRNNIIALCDEAQIGWDTDRSNCFQQNIVYFKTGKLFTRDKFESFDTVIDFNVYFNPDHPIKFLDYTFDEWKRIKGRGRGFWLPNAMDSNSLVADPLFVDVEKNDFHLRPESPAFKLGFRPIDLTTVGRRR